MFVLPSGVRRVRSGQRNEYLVAAGAFVVLGFHVGVWAVQLPELAAALSLDAGSLGTAVTAASAAGIVTLLGGGLLADRLGRRPVLLAGFSGVALAFLLLSQVDHFTELLLVAVMYGLFVSFVDLGANTVGADYEGRHGIRVMTGLHAGFSLGALLGALASAAALWAGLEFRWIYVALAVVMGTSALVTTVAPLPPKASPRSNRSLPRQRMAVLRIPAVCFAIVLASMCFFNEGVLETFVAVYLRGTLESGVLLSGAGIAAYHCASLFGRVLATRVLGRFGERVTIATAGLVAAVGMTLAAVTPWAGTAIGGLLLVGFALAPIVPSALSLAGRSAPGRSGQAVAATTAAGYSAFILSPALAGMVADATSLRIGLAVLIPTSIAIASLALRWPSPQPFRTRTDSRLSRQRPF